MQEQGKMCFISHDCRSGSTPIMIMAFMAPRRSSKPLTRSAAQFRFRSMLRGNNQSYTSQPASSLIASATQRHLFFQASAQFTVPAFASLLSLASYRPLPIGRPLFCLLARLLVFGSSPPLSSILPVIDPVSTILRSRSTTLWSLYHPHSFRSRKVYTLV